MLRKLFSILRSISYSSSDKHESSFSPKNFLRTQTLCLDKFATHCSNMRWADDRSRTHCLEASRSSSFFDKLSASYFRCYMKIYSCKKYLLPWQRSNPTKMSKSYVSCYQLVLLHISYILVAVDSSVKTVKIILLCLYPSKVRRKEWWTFASCSLVVLLVSSFVRSL